MSTQVATSREDGRVCGMSDLARTLGGMAKSSSTKSQAGGTTAGKSPQFRCAECGWQSLKWVGRCGECQAWGTVEQVGLPPSLRPGGRGTAAGPVTAPARPIAEVDVDTAQARPTGLDELDRVLGGGLVPGAVVLLAGEPGVGKSTLLLEVAALCAGRASAGAGQHAPRPALYITGEESVTQVRLRADRVGAVDPALYLAAETDLSAVLGHITEVEPDLLIVDSVQTVASGEVEGAPGGVTQVREVAGALIKQAKLRDLTTVLVGHVTKDGSIAGPRVLEHLVDVVLQFEGERHSRLRMVRAVKNRYGPTDELGCFDLGESGLTGLADPSGVFLSRRAEQVSGTCVTVTADGRRPLVAEVQALVAPSALTNPRRATAGLDSARIAMVLAVLERRAGIRIGPSDVYAATVGGVRLTEPSVDLAVALAVASAVLDRPLPADLVAIGEVGLAGELRPVSGIGRRLIEAERLGFRHALVPGDPGQVPAGIKTTAVQDLAAALRTALGPR